MLIQHRSILNQSSRLRWNATSLLRCSITETCDWGQLALRYLACSAFGNWLCLNGSVLMQGHESHGPSCFHRAEEKSFQQMEWRGSVDYTCSLSLGVMVETEGKDWKDPLKFFYFLFSLCNIYQWDGDIRVWNGIPGVCLMTFLAVWRRRTDVFDFAVCFHVFPCGPEEAKVRFGHWEFYLWLSQGDSLKFGWSWGPDE